MNKIGEKIRKWWKDNGIKGVQLKVDETAVIFNIGKYCFCFSTQDSESFCEDTGYLKDKIFGGRTVRSDVQEWISKKIPPAMMEEAG